MNLYSTTLSYILGLIFFLSASSIWAQLNVQIIHSDPSAPANSFEVCPGTAITISYQGLGSDVQWVEFRNLQGTASRINVSPAVTVLGTGTINITVPVNVATGTLILGRGLSNVLYNSLADEFRLLLANNADIQFGLMKAPICATDEYVEFWGFPSSGSLEASDTSPFTPRPALVDNGLRHFLPEALDSNNSTTNYELTTFTMRYRYTPRYSNGQSCPEDRVSPVVLDTVRDNRLNQFVFQPIVVNTGIVPSDFEIIDSLLSPGLTRPFIGSGLNYDFSYESPYYLFDSITNEQRFLYGLSGVGGHPVTVRYQNGGCEGVIRDAVIEVVPPLEIVGLPDTLCTESAPIEFRRDLNYRDTTIIDSVRNFANQVVYRSVTRRAQLTDTLPRVIGLPSPSALTAGAIQILNNTNPNLERYAYNPSTIDPGLDSVQVEMYYISTTDVFFNQNLTATNPVFLGSPDTSFRIIITVRKTVVMLPRPEVRIDSTLAFRHCHNATPLQLNSQPDFEMPSRTYYTVRDLLNNNMDNLAPTRGDSIPFFELYTRRNPSMNRNVELEMIYTIDRFGCVDRDTQNFIIVAPVRPQFIGRYPTTNTYCFNEQEDELIGTPFFITGGPQTEFSGPGMGVLNNGSSAIDPRTFSPRQAGIGAHPITYTYEDSIGCISELTDTLRVRELPEVTLRTVTGNTSFCADQTAVVLRVDLLSGAGVSQILFFGNSVNDSIFNPNARFSGGAGTALVFSEYIDTFGCRVSDSMLIRVDSVPVVQINGLPSQFCLNDTAQVVSLTPSLNSGLGVLTGVGMAFQDSFYTFNPALVASPGIYNINYSFTNSFNCRAEANQTIRVDSIPIVSLQGLSPTGYCINELTDSLQGIPDPSINLGTGFYSGPGINDSTGVFDPIQAGTGTILLSYTFTDSRECSNSSEDSVRMKNLPEALFTGLNSEYCIDAPDDTLSPVDSMGVGYFIGVAVLDSALGVIRPSLDLPGLRTISFSFTDLEGCTDTSTQNYFIQPLPQVSIAGLDSAYCQNSPEGRAIGVPVGGVFTGNRTNTGLTNIAPGVEAFEPHLADTGIHRFTYRFQDPVSGCVNRDSFDLLVFPSYIPTVTGLPVEVCEVRDTFELLATPSGGSFTGQGILAGTNRFLPTLAGVARHDIFYTKVDSFFYGPSNTLLLCQNRSTDTVRVHPQPVAAIDVPLNNTAYCSNETDTVHLQGSIGGGGLPDWYRFRGNAVQLSIDTLLDFSTGTVVFDTSYFFIPNTAGIGTQSLVYTAFNNFGCGDSATHSVIINPSPNPTFTPLNSAYCENDPSINLVGSPQQGGQFRRNGTPLTPPVFVPAPQPLTAPSIDTITYFVSISGCEGEYSQYLTVFPKPQVVFSTGSPTNSFCLVDTLIALQASPAGGSFMGNGIVFGSDDFSPRISGVGIHDVTYAYQDPITTCSDTHTEVFSVFSQPQAFFRHEGFCEDQVLQFFPDNDSLGLLRFFQGQYDSLTQLSWDFGDASPPQSPSPLTQHSLDSVSYQYSGPADYRVQLFVENQGTCRDSFSTRITVSPKVSSFPYLEDFDASNGNWLPEDAGSQQSTLWEWAYPNNPNGIDASTTSNASNMWITAPTSSYTPGIDAWVYSPCFDLSALERPMMTFDYWSHSETALDGAVLQYRNSQGQWQALGQLNRGINWYNTPIIVGTPGEQNLAPRGWSGFMDTFANARYKLDEIRYNSQEPNLYQNVQFRIAFGASPVASSSFSDGFAFDNVRILDRSRNVLLEHNSNVGGVNMAAIDNHVYNLVFSRELARDVVLLQYQNENPLPDQFYQYNSENHNARNFYYSFENPGFAVVNGNLPITGAEASQNLEPVDFEQDMLEDPKFNIRIDNFDITGGLLSAAVQFKANEDMPFGDYKLRLAVIEDTLDYSLYPNRVHAVLRRLLPEDGFTYTQAFAAEDSFSVSESWNISSEPLNPNRLSIVAFIQEDSSKQVYQVASSRDISVFLSTSPSAEAQQEHQRLTSAKIYPNPARESCTIELNQAPEQALDWQLIDLHGRVLQQGQWPEGQEQMQLNFQLPSGSYFFVARNASSYIQRQLIIRSW